MHTTDPAGHKHEDLRTVSLDEDGAHAAGAAAARRHHVRQAVAVEQRHLQRSEIEASAPSVLDRMHIIQHLL